MLKPRETSQSTVYMSDQLPPRPGGVDVVVPLYNNEKYAVDAVRSALGQTFPIGRVIVVDDGSEDRSADVIETVFADDSRVLIIRGEHKGLPATRNRAIARSDAEFLAFLDSDDVWYSDKIEKQMRVFMCDQTVDLVYCAYDDIDEEGKELATTNKLVPTLRGSVHNELLAGNLISGGSAAVVKRSVIDAVGGFDESLVFAEDWDMWLRVAKNHRVDFVPESLLAIRRHARQMTSGDTKFKRLKRLSQHLRIWSKWPEDVPNNKDVLDSITYGLFSLYTWRQSSLRRRIAFAYIVRRRMRTYMNPEIKRALSRRIVVFFIRGIVFMGMRIAGRLIRMARLRRALS